MRASGRATRISASFVPSTISMSRSSGRPKGRLPTNKSRRNALLDQLKARGKWPAKPDLLAWFGDKGTEWQDRKTKEFRRAVTLPDDVELITRHEVQAAPPDLLVTNYSMLEYMLMRPIERPIFDKTRDWLEQNPSEKFLIVLDEAHLYRGAAGAEVGLLLRRLRDRLNIPPERFQVICATASFKDARLCAAIRRATDGRSCRHVSCAIQGDFAWRPHAAQGTQARRRNPRSHRPRQILQRAKPTRSARVTDPAFLDYRHVSRGDGAGSQPLPGPGGISAAGPSHQQHDEAGAAGGGTGPRSIPGRVPAEADAAATVLMALGSMARTDPKAPGLLPCRIHNFFRGLAGLWVCMDAAAANLPKTNAAAFAARCTASRANAANAARASMNSIPADSAEPPMRAPIRTMWTALPRSGPSRADACGWKTAKRVRCFRSTCFLNSRTRYAPG